MVSNTKNFHSNVLAIDNGAATESAAKFLAVVNGAAKVYAAAPYASTASATCGIGSTSIGEGPPFFSTAAHHVANSGVAVDEISPPRCAILQWLCRHWFEAGSSGR